MLTVATACTAGAIIRFNERRLFASMSGDTQGRCGRQPEGLGAVVATKRVHAFSVLVRVVQLFVTSVWKVRIRTY